MELIEKLLANPLGLCLAAILIPSVALALSVMSRETDRHTSGRPRSYPGTENTERIKKKK